MTCLSATSGLWGCSTTYRHARTTLGLLLLTLPFGGHVVHTLPVSQLAGKGSVSVRSDGLVKIYIDQRRSSNAFDVLPEKARSATRDNLELGTYYVSATQGEDLVSSIKQVSVDATHPSAVAELELTENHAELFLSDLFGTPVRDARIRPLSPPHMLLRVNFSLKQDAPGHYLLSGVRPGMYLLIRPERFVPACRIVPLNETLVVALESGRTVNAELPLMPAELAELAALEEVVDSNCPVPLSEFRPEAIVRAGQHNRYLIKHFPSSYRFVLTRAAGERRRIFVQDNGMTVVERE